MNNIFKHLKLVLTHKYYVLIECFKVGLYWQGIVHDLSKFHPVEFFESAKYFTGTGSPINESKKANGYSEAWLHHKGRNKHHWQYWIDFKGKQAIPLDIPDKYILEMSCDIKAASKAYLKDRYTSDSPRKYVELHLDKWMMTENTKNKLVVLL